MPSLKPLKQSAIKPDISDDNLIIDKKTKLKKKLFNIRTYVHAATIQAIWRGKMARLFAKKAYEKQQSQNMKTSLLLEHISSVRLDRIETIKLKIHYCFNLPLNCTGTRIIIRIMNSSFQEIGLNVFECFSDMASDCCNPLYNNEIEWKVSTSLRDQIRSALIVLRIDTLDRLSLKHKCVGYGLLNVSKSEKFNGGRHLLRLLYGNFPKNNPLNDSLDCSVPTLGPSFMIVSLFDSSNNTGTSFLDLNAINSLVIKNTNEFECNKGFEGSCALVALLSYKAKKIDASLPPFKITEDVERFIKSGGDLSNNIVTKSFSDWFKHVMSTSVPKKFVSKSAMFYYSNIKGLYVGLDGLNNMPSSRSIPLPADAKAGISQKLQMFRCYLRVLPGASDSSATKYVDISKKVDMESSEQSPRFLDDLIHVVDPKITPSACALLRIIAVDVYIFGAKSTKGLKISAYRNSKQNWWGLVPLLHDSPYPCKESLISNDVKTSTCFVGSHLVPLFEGTPPKSIIHAPDPFTALLKEVNATYISEYYGDNFSMCSCLGSRQDKQVSAPTDCKLSKGASAVVRVIDPQTKDLGNVRLSEAPPGSISPVEVSSEAIFRAALNLNANLEKSKDTLDAFRSKFRFQSKELESADKTSRISDYISPFIEPSVFTDKVNELCISIEQDG